jgi:hypothetical protein
MSDKVWKQGRYIRRFRYLHGSSGSVRLSTDPGCFEPSAWNLQKGASYKWSWGKSLYYLTNTVCLLVTPCLFCSSYFPEKASVPFMKLTDAGRVSTQVVYFSWPVLCCLPGCFWIISTVPMVRNIFRHFLYLFVRFLIGLIVALFSSNSFLFHRPYKCTRAGLWTRIFGWKAVQNSSRLPPVMTEVIVIFFSK